LFGAITRINNHRINEFMIKAENIKKYYGDIPAVDGISFEIRPGETFGLLGPNGAGKTTTINMLTGILKPDEGKILIKGTDNRKNSDIRRLVGYAPQSLAIYDELSGEENLAFFGKLYGLRGVKLKKQIDWTLDFAGLQNKRSELVKTYSGGMKRRLNLVCALIHNPPILFLDEPTVGVDPQSRNQIFDRIEQLKSEGKTIVYTTHYIEEAQRLCERVGIIDYGKLLALDTVEALIEEYGGMSVIEAELQSPPSDMERIPGLIGKTKLRLETEHPLEDLARLMEKNIKFKEIKIVKSDLEAVFLNLTGRSLRD